MDQYRFPALPKYWSMPYTLRNGDEQVLSRWNMMQESGYVSRMQCLVKILPDGTPMLTSIGKAPTLVRTRGGPWQPLYNRQQQYPDAVEACVEIKFRAPHAIDATLSP